jgi:LCP family protein required for cell wall assembly
VIERPPRPGLSLLRRAAIASVLIVLLTAGAVSAAVFLQVSDLQHAFDPTGNGSHDIRLPDISPAEAGKPQTIMILGTDGRLGADASITEAQRSDTILLARLDATKGAITLMSIPRDLKVNIPGLALPDKINAAFANGGADLTVKTVKRLLSTPGHPFKINHVVQVNFEGFHHLVNYLGCVYVDIDHHYFNDQGGPGGYAVIDIPEGYQKLCGKDALSYVRYRHTDSDIVRGARQQDFVRQMLRQPGVRKRLNFGARDQLARLAGRYTRTDHSLRSTTQLFSLLKLGLAVANKPIEQVAFGAGQIADDGAYLTAPPDAIHKTVEQFLNPRVASSPAPAKTSGRHHRHHANSSSLPSGTVADKSQFLDAAISLDRRLSFPFYFPTVRMGMASPVGTVPRHYQLRDDQHHLHSAYRIVMSLGVAGEYYGIQGLTWKTPPILDGAHDTVRAGGRKLLVYYDGHAVRLVAWRTKRAVYYVENTLERNLSRSQMIAIAASLHKVGH